MYRSGIGPLKAWKEKEGHLPLVIHGARQVGKSWLVDEFGRTCFKNVVKLDFDKNKNNAKLFGDDISPERLLKRISAATGQRIVPGGTLLFFDEIQEAPRAMTSLKYFAEDAPEYHVIAAGSLLGITEHRGHSFPVGKVEFFDLYPMTFKEFLIADGQEGLAGLLDDDIRELEPFHDTYVEKLKEYMLVGGMPAAVDAWVRSHDIEAVRQIHVDIMRTYVADLSKHAPSGIARQGAAVLDSVPDQLAKENRKFMYSTVEKGARAKDYQEAFAWLNACKIINRIYRVTCPGLPMKAYMDRSVFKLFLHDIGLLSSQAGINPGAWLGGDPDIDIFKGAMAEQYVLQELIASGWNTIAYYSNDRSTAEVDFLLDSREGIIPLEVKSGKNTKAKSLSAYNKKFSPKQCLRASLLPYKEQDWLVNIPLYAVSRIPQKPL